MLQGYLLLLHSIALGEAAILNIHSHWFQVFGIQMLALHMHDTIPKEDFGTVCVAFLKTLLALTYSVCKDTHNISTVNI